MGNFLNKIRAKNIQTKDNTRLLLIADLEEKLNNSHNTIMERYSNIVGIYNSEISNLKLELQNLNEENKKTVRKVDSLNILINEKDSKIKMLESKMLHLETSDEFLSAIHDE